MSYYYKLYLVKCSVSLIFQVPIVQQIKNKTKYLYRGERVHALCECASMYLYAVMGVIMLL